MIASDIEGLTALENAAERRQIRRLNLAAQGVRTESRIGQRAWARGLQEAEHAELGRPVPIPGTSTDRRSAAGGADQ